MLHPHIHCIVPGGGIEGNRNWKNTKSQDKYFFPVKEIKKVYRDKIVSALRKQVRQEKINDFGKKFMADLFKRVGGLCQTSVPK